MSIQECVICTRHIDHGGKCYGQEMLSPCLIFQKDIRGNWIIEDKRIQIPLGYPIPNVKEKVEVTLNEVDKTIEMLKIISLEWHMEGRKGLRGIILKAKIGYWSDENGIFQDKPKLKLIKGGEDNE